MKSPPARRASQINWLPILTFACVTAGLGCGDESSLAPRLEAPRLVSVRGNGMDPLHGGGGNGEDIRKTTTISASKGGSLSAGRHRLTFPPGALQVDTQITIVDATNRAGFVECELYPEGIRFQRPVTLETQFADIVNPNGYSMYWLVKDSSVDLWMNVGGQPTSDGKGITVSLSHFSTYAPGKTGW